MKKMIIALLALMSLCVVLLYLFRKTDKTTAF